jgi:hypothetical protein
MSLSYRRQPTLPLILLMRVWPGYLNEHSKSPWIKRRITKRLAAGDYGSVTDETRGLVISCNMRWLDLCCDDLETKDIAQVLRPRTDEGSRINKPAGEKTRLERSAFFDDATTDLPQVIRQTEFLLCCVKTWLETH